MASMQLYHEKIETEKGYAEIKMGMISLISKYNIILHKIHPQQIMLSLEKFRESLRNVTDQDYKHLIETELNVTEIMLHTLIPRRSRRGLINAGGRLLSWAVGTLDDEDKDAIDQQFAELEKGNNEIVKTLNRQVELNENFNRTLRQLEKVIANEREMLLEDIKEAGTLRQELVEETSAILKLFTITSLKQQVYIIQQNIVAASTGSFHPGILSKSEIETNDITFEKLKHVKIGAATYKQKTIVLAVRIPSQTQQGNKIIRVAIPNSNKEQIDLGMETEVQFNNKSYAFNGEDNIFKLKESTSCVIRGKCNVITNKAEQLLELDNNMVLALNQNDQLIQSSCDQRLLKLKGHYLLTYNNCSIQINNVTFRNTVTEYEQKFVIPDETKKVFGNKVLSLEEIIFNQEQNIEKLKELHLHRIVTTTTSTTSTIVSIIIIACIIAKCIKNKRKETGPPRKLPRRKSISIRSLIRKYPTTTAEPVPNSSKTHTHPHKQSQTTNKAKIPIPPPPPPGQRPSLAPRNTERTTVEMT